MVGGCWPGEAEGRLTRNGTSYVIGFTNIFGFPCLVLSWKQGQKVEKMVIIDKILTLLGQLLQRCGLAYWTGCCNDLWVRSPDHIWSGCRLLVYSVS